MRACDEALNYVTKIMMSMHVEGRGLTKEEMDGLRERGYVCESSELSVDSW